MVKDIDEWKDDSETIVPMGISNRVLMLRVR